MQKDNPNFVYPELQQSVAQEMPSLLPTDQLAKDSIARVGTTVSPHAELARRIARLRRKVARLSAYRF